MHAEDREKLLALMAAVLLAPRFEQIAIRQDRDSAMLHDPLIQGALRTARILCDAVEDQESRHDAVVFDAPAESEQSDDAVSRAARHLGAARNMTQTVRSEQD